jgi:hypothetical protein
LRSCGRHLTLKVALIQRRNYIASLHFLRIGDSKVRDQSTNLKAQVSGLCSIKHGWIPCRLQI